MAEPLLAFKNVRAGYGEAVVLDDISFSAPDRGGEEIRIDAAYVKQHVGDLAKNADLSRFIL